MIVGSNPAKSSCVLASIRYAPLGFLAAPRAPARGAFFQHPAPRRPLRPRAPDKPGRRLGPVMPAAAVVTVRSTQGEAAPPLPFLHRARSRRESRAPSECAIRVPSRSAFRVADARYLLPRATRRGGQCGRWPDSRRSQVDAAHVRLPDAATRPSAAERESGIHLLSRSVSHQDTGPDPARAEAACRAR